MRKIIILPSLFFALVLVMFSCKKYEVLQDVNSLGIGSYVTLQKTVNLNVDATNLGGSKVSIEVAEYGSPQEKIILYVTKGNTSLNRANWKKLKEFPINGGKYVLEVSGQEIATALGVTPAPGEQYTLYNQIVTKDGNVFDIANTGEFSGIGAYNMALTWKATIVCPFDATAAAGTYVITTDGWDGATGEEVLVTATSNSASLKYAFPYAAEPYENTPYNPLVLNINPTTGAVTVAKQVYGNYLISYGIGGVTAAGSGYFFACTQTITMTLAHVSVAGTNYGTYPLVLKKK